MIDIRYNEIGEKGKKIAEKINKEKRLEVRYW